MVNLLFALIRSDGNCHRAHRTRAAEVTRALQASPCLLG
jgi:hypothetical protein